MAASIKNNSVSSGRYTGIFTILPSVLVGLAAFFLFFAGSEPTISWNYDSQDSGELAAAAACRGIPHPTGYPLYMIIGGLLIRLFSLVDPGRVMVLVSVVCGALAVGVTARIGGVVAGILFRNNPVMPVGAAWIGALGGAFPALSPLVWSQSVVCEVYAPALFLQSMVWLFLIRYLKCLDEGDEGGAIREFGIAGFTMGLVASHHLLGLSVLIPLVVIFIFRHPKETAKTGLIGILAAVPGLLLYLYLPLASMANPPLDWGNPETLNNFRLHVSAAQYRGNVIFSPIGPYETRFFYRSLVIMFLTTGILEGFLILVGFITALLPLAGRSVKNIAWGWVLLVIPVLFFVTQYSVSDVFNYMYPLIVPTTLVTCIGLALIYRLISRFGPTVAKVLAVMVLVFLSWSLYINSIERTGIRRCNLPVDSAVSFVNRELPSIPENAVVIVSTDGYFSALTYASVCGMKTTDKHFTAHAARDDILVLPSYWIRSEWYHENLLNRGVIEDREALDDLRSMGMDEATAEFIKLMLPNRPVMVDRRGTLDSYGLSIELPGSNILVRAGYEGEFEYPPSDL